MARSVASRRAGGHGTATLNTPVAVRHELEADVGGEEEGAEEEREGDRDHGERPVDRRPEEGEVAGAQALLGAGAPKRIPAAGVDPASNGRPPGVGPCAG
jgi:hypothetical protein